MASDPGAISGTGGYTVITLNVNNGQQIKIFQEREDGTIYAETHNSSGERRGVTFISPGDMTGLATPVNGSYKGEEMRRKVCNSGSREFISLTSYSNAYPYDGIGKNFSSYA